jgi:hypothetical protein
VLKHSLRTEDGMEFRITAADRRQRAEYKCGRHCSRVGGRSAESKERGRQPGSCTPPTSYCASMESTKVEHVNGDTLDLRREILVYSERVKPW